MIEYFSLILLGVLIGTITGILPGLHPNTIAFMTLPFYLATSIELYVYMSILAGLAVSHTFHEFLPAIILGAPEADSALSALPGAEMTMEGEARKAFKYSVFGGIFALLTLIALFPLLYYLAANYYNHIEPYMPGILAFFLLFIAVYAHNILYSTIIVILSGKLGILSFEVSVNSEYVLVAVFSGLFAVPAIINNLMQNFELPKQTKSRLSLFKSSKGGFTGFLAGILSGIVPGIGAAVATSFLTPVMARNKEGAEEEFIAGMGGVNTVDIVVSFLALYLIGNPRSGTAVALQNVVEVGIEEIMFVAGASLFAAGIAIPLSFKTLDVFLAFTNQFDFNKILAAVLVFLILVNTYLTGLLGILIFGTAACIGWAALKAGERSSCMAVLLVPTTLFLSDVGIFM